eukprot:CAMPEP_0116559280 /NCGR_PEP_ID=MMETSP0397-20121206/10305_1 /TAXON_ID=216820 /ORGANISM="Cyclophora tenuis, Strain ECT3854" /LENGTH=121 /DNA_ID=CAMNT_0004085025 /DNA_START=9 /DNA_END=375 /DNA_ORIENTATION=-
MPALSLQCDRAVIEHIGQSVANPSYIPAELCGAVNGSTKTAKSKKNVKSELNDPKKELSLEEIAAKVKSEIGPSGGEEGDGEIVETVEDEEEEDGEDYITNYYQSEDDESAGGGDDAEPTF